MKKIILILAMLAMCSLILCSCKGNNGEADGMSEIQSTVTDETGNHETAGGEESDTGKNTPDTEPDSDSGDRLNDRYWSQNYIPKK